MPIPTELTERKQWVNWRYGDLRPNNKRAKVPYIPGTSRKARVDDPTTWGKFETAESDFSQDDIQIGYVFTEEDGFAGIDLDHCIEDNKVLPWAKDIVLKFNSYTEVSPSGTGLHILVRTTDLLPSLNQGDIEIYTHDRYFTVTGQHIAGPETIEDRTELLNKFHANPSPQGCEGPILATEAEKSPIPPVEDKWTLLAAGDWEGAGYISQSEADLAYANHLRGTTKGNREEAEELFRETGLYTSRDPGEAERKLEMTFNKAFEDAKEKEQWRGYTMSEILEASKDLEWAWENWIPKGHLTMVAGAQGVGKSYFAAALIAAVAGYQPWPDAAANTRPSNVLLTETEGMKGEYAKRLRALGVDGTKGEVIFAPQRDAYEHLYLDSDIYAFALSALFEEYNPGMLVIDSLSGAHAGKENDASMRQLMQQCTVWASKLNIPIVLVHHERKRREKEASKTTIDRVRGSSTITQFCRSIIGIWREGEDDTVRIEIIKSNFAAPPEAVGMQISGSRPKFGDPPQVVATGSPAVQDAIDFLREVLKGGPVPITRIKEQADAQMIAKNTLYRARTALGVEGVKVLRTRCWSMPKEFVINISGELD